MVIHQSDTAKSLGKQHFLLVIWIYSEFICFVCHIAHFLFLSFCPWFSIYFFITSIGAPPIVSKQNSDTKSILSIISAVSVETLFSKVCCLHSCRRLWTCLFPYSGVPWKVCVHGLCHDSILQEWCCNLGQYTQKFPLLCLRYYHQRPVCDTSRPVQDGSVTKTLNGHYYLNSLYYSLSNLFDWIHFITLFVRCQVVCKKRGTQFIPHLRGGSLLAGRG